MSVKRAANSKRRQARKKSKISNSKAYGLAPNEKVIDLVRPRLIEYIQSESKYIEIFKSLTRGKIYLVATEGNNTIHTVIDEEEFLGMMPITDQEAMSFRLSLLTIEKVVAYTEDDTGFMTYFFTEEEVI
ncbi:hypothetical protein K0H59_20410 [Shewanella sp. FJAT-51649]|uniref:hypothetical protein n=1 Tax=Shewanella sp. FJAT-51649 TaxID=2864210 RepID=UPI001C65A020|nr:hypothetical protein [Shewanella sp. FJAT-51649]QYJ71341.1 hypothetical protein K0H59_20410 [Shewanella sp. FJAT-51649]